jgi:hypothetical protein
VAHVGEEFRLQLVGPPEVVGPLVELGVERYDASVGVLQFLVKLGECLLPVLQLLDLPQHFLVLAPDLVDWVSRFIRCERLAEAS